MANSLTDQQQRYNVSTSPLAALRGIKPGNQIAAALVGTAIGILVLISPWLALAVTLAVCFWLMALSKPVLLCYAIVAATALTSGMQRGQLIPFLKPNEAVLILSTGIAFTIILTKEPKRKLNLYPLNIGLIILIGGTIIIPAVSYLIRGSPLTIQDWLTLLAPLQYVLLFWLFAYLPNNNLERQRIIQLMLLCGGVVAALGLLQGARLSFVTNLLHHWYGSAHETTAANAGRVTSLMSAWNVLGIFMMVNIFIAWAFGISKPSELGRGLIAVAIGLCTACLIVSGSFASMIGLCLGIATITFLMKGINRKIILLGLILVLMVAAVAVVFRSLIDERLSAQFGYGGAIPQTLAYRFKVWQEIYIPALKQNLVWGINPTVPTSYTWRYTESQYISLLFSFGLIGLAAYLAWIGITLTWLARRFREHRNMLKPVTAIAITIIFVLSLAGFTNAVFTYSGTADYLWIILAIVATIDEVQMPRIAD